MTVRETRTRFDQLLARFQGKSVLDFTVDYCPLLWAITYKASNLDAIDQVEDLILGSLCGVHTYCGDDPYTPAYPDEFNVEEQLRWDVVIGEDKPFLLSEFLTQRIGTCVTYTLVTAIALRSTRDCGPLTICTTNRTNLVNPNHVWLKMDDGRVIDLLSRSQGKKPSLTLMHDREISLK